MNLEDRLRAGADEAKRLFAGDPVPEFRPPGNRGPRVAALAAVSVGIAIAVAAVLGGSGPGRDGIDTASPQVTLPDPVEEFAVAGETTVAPALVRQPEPVMGSRVEGALPDGTPYTVRFDGSVRTAVEGISGVIMIDIDGESLVLGITTFSTHGGPQRPSYEDLVYVAPAGPGSVRIEVYPEVADRVPDVAALLTASIAPAVDGPIPTLELSPPLRWAGDDEVPVHMEVIYHAFVVQRGCGELAVACSDTAAVQVIPADRVRAPAAPLDAASVWIESPAP